MTLYNNIPQGSAVPVSGKYKCEWCGTIDIVGKGSPADVLQGHRKTEAAMMNPTTRWFRAGQWFDKCPRCRDATGWTLVEEGEIKRWWQFWK